MAGVKGLALLGAACFAYWCFLDQYPAVLHACQCTDAMVYTDIGRSWLADGWHQAPSSDLRLYAYPVFLAGLFALAQALQVDAGPVVLVAQVGLYFLAVSVLAREVARWFGAASGHWVFFALVLNPLVYPLLAISLTDGVALCGVLLLAAVVLRIAFDGPRALRMALLGLVCGLVIMFRPAYVFLLAVPVLAACWAFRRQSRFYMGLVAALACGLGFLLAVAPQVYINHTYHQAFTFMPVYQLGDFQIRVGLSMLKYATDLTDNTVSMPYTNPLFDGGDAGLRWYFTNPVPGLLTMLLHAFAALDFDHLTVYVFDREPSYRPWLFLFSHFANFWGAVGVIAWVWRQRRGVVRLATLQQPQGYVVLSLAFVVLGWAAVVAISAVENRFAIPVVTLLLPFAWAAATGAARTPTRWRLWAAFGLYLAAAGFLTRFLDGLKV